MEADTFVSFSSPGRRGEKSPTAAGQEELAVSPRRIDLRVFLC